jgi:hypothetical protein
VAAVLATAAPIIAAMSSILKSITGKGTEDVIQEAAAAGGNIDPTAADKEAANPDTGSEGFTLSPLMIGGAALAAYLIFKRK